MTNEQVVELSILIELADYVCCTSPRAIDIRPQELQNIPADPNPYYYFLFLLARRRYPKVMVELGTLRGIGALHLGYGNPNGVVYSVDNHQTVSPALPNVYFIEGDTRNRDEKLFPDNSIDLLFIDSTHQSAHARQEYEVWLPALAPKAILLADDIYMDGMRGFWESIPEPKFAHDGLHSTCGFGVSIVEKTP